MKASRIDNDGLSIMRIDNDFLRQEIPGGNQKRFQRKVISQLILFYSTMKKKVKWSRNLKNVCVYNGRNVINKTIENFFFSRID